MTKERDGPAQSSVDAGSRWEELSLLCSLMVSTIQPVSFKPDDLQLLEAETFP